jgi:hypothetical protein
MVTLDPNKFTEMFGDLSKEENFDAACKYVREKWVVINKRKEERIMNRKRIMNKFIHFFTKQRDGNLMLICNIILAAAMTISILTILGVI